MVALECDNSNEIIQQDKSTLFVLGSDQKLLHIQESGQSDQMFTCIGVYDFSGYDMTRIVGNFWSHCHVTAGTITYDELVYAANGKDKKKRS